jgi:hypothetical protein
VDGQCPKGQSRDSQGTVAGVIDCPEGRQGRALPQSWFVMVLRRVEDRLDPRVMQTLPDANLSRFC